MSQLDETFVDRLVNTGRCAHRIRVDACSRPDAEWVMLSNSLGTDLTLWEEQIGLLTSKFNVLRYDQRGAGLSEAPKGSYSLPMLADDALALLDELEVPQVHFIGISIGGVTGIQMALDHPGRLHSVTCSNAIATADQAYREGWVQRIAMVERKGIASVVEPTIERWLTTEFINRCPSRAADLRSMLLKTSPDGYIGAASALLGLDFDGRLGEIKIDTLYLAGEHDTAAPIETIRRMAAATPHAKFQPIAASAHLSCVDAAHTFGNAIANFLQIADLK